MQTKTFRQKPTVFVGPKLGPIAPSNRYGWGLDTRREARLERAATWRLIKAGFYSQVAEEFDVLPAECCGSGKGLSPLWHAELPKPGFVEAEEYRLTDDDREWLGCCQAA